VYFPRHRERERERERESEEKKEEEQGPSEDGARGDVGNRETL